MKSQNVWCVDGVRPFQVYSTINWILHYKVDGENNNVWPPNYKQQSTGTQWNNQPKYSLKMNLPYVGHVGGPGHFEVYTTINLILCCKVDGMYNNTVIPKV